MRLSSSARILLALVAGLAFGIWLSGLNPGWLPRSIAIAEPIGALWLDALRMTIIPLVFSLLVTLNSVESTFNRIWRAPVAPPSFASNLENIPICTLRPRVAATSLAVTTSFFAMVWRATSRTKRGWFTFLHSKH